MTYRLLEKLTELQDNVNNGNPPVTGICDYVEATPSQKWLLRKVWQRWINYSGDRYFPVPSGNKHVDTRLVYFMCPNGEYFNPETEYGRLRLELLEFLIDELEDGIGIERM